jgi:hypothetical protein
MRAARSAPVKAKPLPELAPLPAAEADAASMSIRNEATFVPPLEVGPVAVQVFTPKLAGSNVPLSTESVGVSVPANVTVSWPVLLAVAVCEMLGQEIETLALGAKRHEAVNEADAGELEVLAEVTVSVALDEQLVETALVGGVVDAVVVAAPAAETGNDRDSPATPSTMTAAALPILIRTYASSSSRGLWEVLGTRGAKVRQDISHRLLHGPGNAKHRQKRPHQGVCAN